MIFGSLLSMRLPAAEVSVPRMMLCIFTRILSRLCALQCADAKQLVKTEPAAAKEVSIFLIG